MDVYSDYGNWKFENFTLIDELVKLNSSIISRFLHVINVTDHFYNKRLELNKDLPNEEEIIFETGFNYIHDHFNTVQMIKKNIFNNNVKELNKYAKTVNLLLYTNDFQNELMNTYPDEKESIRKLADFEERTLKYLESKTEAPDTMFALLSDLTNSIFDDYYSVNEIIYDVAIELGLAPDEEDLDIDEEF